MANYCRAVTKSLRGTLCKTLPGREKLNYYYKKRFAIFPSPAGMSLTKLSLDRKNLIVLVQGEFG
jgi:hypothetical protein